MARSSRERRRTAHRSVDSTSDLLPRSRAGYRRTTETPEPSPTKPKESRRRHRDERDEDEERRRRRRERRREKEGREREYVVEERVKVKSSGNALSVDALAKLDRLNGPVGEVKAPEKVRVKKNRDRVVERVVIEREEVVERKRERKREKRVLSGHALERGEEEELVVDEKRRLRQRGGAASEAFSEVDRKRRQRKRLCIAVALVVIILAIAIPVGVVVANKKASTTDDSTSTSSSSSKPSNSNLDGISESSIPSWAKGTYLDPFDWYDTTDFNVTFTNATVGGLYVMGLNSTWDDNTRANDNVPALNESWTFGTATPIRGINLGGWLSIEPVITPSLFDSYSSVDGIVDEWTLCEKLGSDAKATIEPHYSSFVTESTFQEIQAAGFDHVRIPFSYWAVTTYTGDPYVEMVSWRYLLRAIEWARKYGLRIDLDLHGAPGSQNGWNHSGHQGSIGWLNGTDGTLNAQRTTDIHNQLSQFFAQDRYKYIINIYGLVNEPRMTALDVDAVLDWTTSVSKVVRANNITAYIAFGDGFRGLTAWQGELTDVKDLVIDAHQYVIFDVSLLAYNHYNKTNYACAGWTAQAKESMSTSTGFGPTIFGEFSQADTDCAEYLNDVNVGTRWEGTYDMSNTPGGLSNESVSTQTCATSSEGTCSCTNANADPSSYSAEYKLWLLQFAEAQMHSFEYGWGWFYWTWQTESADQWSYKAGMAAGILPAKAYERSFNCSSIPDYAGAGLAEDY